MRDVNEQIVKAYFEEVYGYVVRTNIYFKKKGKKGGAGPADIDLVMIHPKKGKFEKRVIVTVKGWQGVKIRKGSISDRKKFKNEWKIFQKQEVKAADKFFGKNKYKKILVLPPIKIDDKEYCKELVKKRYDILLMDFSDILFKLMKNLLGENLEGEKKIWRSFDSEFLQTLRIVLINLFQFSPNQIEINKNFVHWLGWKKTHNINIKFYRNDLVIKNKSLKN